MIESLPLEPNSQEEGIVISMQMSEWFTPWAAVTIRSILDHVSPAYRYELLCMTWDMREETADALATMISGLGHVSLRVVNVKDEVHSYVLRAKKQKDFDRFSQTGVIRLVLPQLLSAYDKVLNIDCDLLVRSDLWELGKMELGDACMMGTTDSIACYQNACSQGGLNGQFSDDHLFRELSLTSVDDYLNAGVFLLNLKQIRLNFTTEEIMSFATKTGKFFTCYEQDTFNGLFRDQKKKFPGAWNWECEPFIREGIVYSCPSQTPWVLEYLSAEKSPKVIHFAGNVKPWTHTRMPWAYEWWRTAERTPFFREICRRTRDGK